MGTCVGTHSSALKESHRGFVMLNYESCYSPGPGHLASWAFSTRIQR